MKENTHQMTHRVITMVNREELEFLDRMGKDSLFSTGHKLSYNEILRGLIDFAMEAGISGEKVGSFEELRQKLNQIMQRMPRQG